MERGVKSPHSLLPVPVSLTRSGYPRIIPSFHRILIYKRDDRSDQLVQLYLSLFSMYRIVEIGKKITKDTFESIVKPVDDIDRVYEFVCKVKETFPTLIRRYVPDITTIPLHQGMVWLPTWKALPSYPVLSDLWMRYGRHEFRKTRASRLCLWRWPGSDFW